MTFQGRFVQLGIAERSAAAQCSFALAISKPATVSSLQEQLKMNGPAFIALLWFCYAVPGGLITIIVLCWQRRPIRWKRWELLALVLPFCVWFAMTCLQWHPSGKGDNNFFVEPALIGCGMPATALLCMRIKRPRAESSIALGCLVGQCFLAAYVTILTPNLGGSLMSVITPTIPAQRRPRWCRLCKSELAGADSLAGTVRQHAKP